MSLIATSQIVISRNGTYIVGRIMDIIPVAGDTIPVFNYESGSIIFDTISSVTASSSSEQLSEIAVSNGGTVVGTTQLSVMIYQDNAYTFPQLGSIASGTLCPISLLLPNRVGQQVSGGLSINVQMNQNNHDPMIQIPVTTNTWGPLVIQYGDIQKFVVATTDQDDKDILQSIASSNVQFSPVVSSAPMAVSQTPIDMYQIQTTSGFPFMLSNGIFIRCNSV